MRRRIGPLALVLATLAASAASAQDRETARRFFDEATRQFDSGNFSLALENFRQSRELLVGDARAQTLILFNVARAHEELGEFREALQAYEEYLANAPSDAPYREETLDRVRELRLRVSRRGAEPGPALAEGGTSPLVLAGGLVAGVGALAALAAIPTGVLALEGRDRLAGECPGGRCPQSAQGRLDETHALGLTTDVLWITGVGLAAVGATLLALGLATSPDSPRVEAFCTGDGCAATLALRF